MGEFALGQPVPRFEDPRLLRGESVLVTREVDGGLQTIKLKGPAIITTDLRQPTRAAAD